MKLIHISDLHLGKRFMEYPMVDEQKDILDKIVSILQKEKPDALLIAGDVYDKTVPTADAVGLLDEFLVSVAAENIPVFIISGNHDSPERLSFGSRFMKKSGVYFASVYDGTTESVTLRDEYGEVEIVLLPFIKPASVRKYAAEFDIAVETCSDAVRFALRNFQRRDTRRLVLLAHQFVVGAETSDSEELSIGGADSVDASVFEEFDYVALGHLHRPQNCHSSRIRYSGTPLKYSFSEAHDKKSVTAVELGKDGDLTVREIPLKPMREMYKLRGSYDELTLKSFWENGKYTEAFLHITLTDEEDIPDAIGKLRAIYHNLMKLDYDNRRTRGNGMEMLDERVEQKTPLEIFREFYENRNNLEMNTEQMRFIEELIEKIWGGCQ